VRQRRNGERERYVEEARKERATGQ